MRYLSDRAETFRVRVETTFASGETVVSYRGPYATAAIAKGIRSRESRSWGTTQKKAVVESAETHWKEITE